MSSVRCAPQWKPSRGLFHPQGPRHGEGSSELLAAEDGALASLPAADAGRTGPEAPCTPRQGRHCCLHRDTYRGAPLGPLAGEFHQSTGHTVLVMAAENVARAGLTGLRPGEAICVSGLEEGRSAREGRPSPHTCGKRRRLVALCNPEMCGTSFGDIGFNRSNGARHE